MNSKPQFPHLYIEGSGWDWINANIVCTVKCSCPVTIYSAPAMCYSQYSAECGGQEQK